MHEIIRDLGQIGAGGKLASTTDTRLIQITLHRGGAAWNLSGLTSPAFTLEVSSIPAGTDVAPNGTIAIVTAATGIVSYTPGTSDPLEAAPSGPYEARIWATPTGKAAIPSDRFRFSLGEGPKP